MSDQLPPEWIEPVTMHLELRIPQQQYDAVAVTNIGHPEHGGHPEDDDLRAYQVTTSHPRARFVVHHHRSNGRYRLAALVFAEIARRRSEPSNLVAHAIRELEHVGQTEEDPMLSASMVAAVEAVHSYGHSGGSMSAAVDMLDRLLKMENLAPLTSDPGEWMIVSENPPMWQNKRNSAVLSYDGGKSYYHVDRADDVTVIADE